MHRKFITLVLSAALAITGLGTGSARADDTAEWIAGAAALAILGYAIVDQKNRDRHAGTTPYYQPRAYGQSAPVVRQPTPYYRSSKGLPPQCVVSGKLQGRKVHGLRRNCLKRFNVNLNALPRECAVKFRNPNTGKRHVIYGGRCLRQQGYRLARSY